MKILLQRHFINWVAVKALRKKKRAVLLPATAFEDLSARLFLDKSTD